MQVKNLCGQCDTVEPAYRYRSAIRLAPVARIFIPFVCPAMFDLGEAKKVVIVSTTEGDDKPLKYPHIFLEADICVINKIDLAPYLDTDVETLRNNALKVNHHLQLFEVSATKGTGMDAWCDWLVKECAKCK